MNNQQLLALLANLKKWFFLLKSDPDTLAESRKLVLGVVASLVLLYSGETLLLAPKRQDLRQKQSQQRELLAAHPPQLLETLASQLSRLELERRALNQQADELALRVRFSEEQWQAVTSPEQFSLVVFTLHPRSPVNMEKNLEKMSQLEAHTENGVTFNTINLAGEASFQNLFRYLRYLEGRAEVSLIDGLAIERAAGPASSQAKVKFSMVVGRTVMEKQP
ncbi:MAG: hypothetical protein ACOY3Z_02380 [Thermodesulfobacteriota bacterium]